MPLMDADAPPQEAASTGRLERLPFPPVTYNHILHCSYGYWYPRYRGITPKARLIPLTDPFLAYLRADGIVLPPEDSNPATTDDDNQDTFSDEEDEDTLGDPSTAWQEIHSQIKSTIAEFGGKVTPKLNWSAPKDATWISATNDLQCRSPNDVYLLLKSSDFITHDLEHPFDGCVADAADAVLTQTPSTQTQSHHPSSPPPPPKPTIPYHLILRKYVNFNPSLEFRCFVRNRVLLCICQRDQNHFDFLFPMRDQLRARIQSFFDEKLRGTFPDGNFVFDVYIPPPHERVWLIDINPWAQRTDPLLFSWLEILTMKDPAGIMEETEDELAEGQFVRLSLNGDVTVVDSNGTQMPIDEDAANVDEEEYGDDVENEDEDAARLLPEFRLVNRDDPEAYSFNTAQYSAHKLPREVVDASRSGPGGMQDFMGQWQDILAGRLQEEQHGSSSEED